MREIGINRERLERGDEIETKRDGKFGRGHCAEPADPVPLRRAKALPPGGVWLRRRSVIARVIVDYSRRARSPRLIRLRNFN